MTVDATKWRPLGTAKPGVEWKPIERNGSPAFSTLVESFLVVFYALKTPNQPDYLYRSKLVLRMIYPQNRYGIRDIETKPIWIRPSSDPQEFTIEYPKALLLDGTIFRTFECRRWNRYRRGINEDGPWEIEIYESLKSLPTGPPSDDDPPPPPTPGWEWIY